MLYLGYYKLFGEKPSLRKKKKSSKKKKKADKKKA